MLAYLEKFSELPQNIKDKISSPEVMNSVSVIEKKYHINLATTLMRIMVGDIKILDLKQFFMFENKLSGPEAETIVEELKKTVFVHVGDFLGIDTGQELKEMKAGEDYEVPEKKVQSSSFFFSSEDEEEVKELTKKLGSMTDGTYDEVDEKVQKIIKLSDVEFASLELNERFKGLLKTYLKGVRNKVGTREAFLKPIADGGLAIDEKTADKIFELAGLGTEEVIKREVQAPTELKIEQVQSAQMASQMQSYESEESNKISQADKARLEQLVNGGGRDIDYNLSAMPKIKPEENEDIKIEGAQSFESVSEILNKSENQSALEPSVKLDDTNVLNIGMSEATNISEPLTLGAKVPEEKAVAKPIELSSESKKIEIKTGEKKPIAEIENIEQGIKPFVIPAKQPTEKNLDEHIAPTGGQYKPRINVEGGGRVKMEDVKYKPKLVGPVDELSNINTVDFRRLDQDPFRAVAKIKDKINVLEEDSFAKRVEGMNAWRQSPIHRMYIELGKKSIVEGKALNQVITEEMIEKGDTLSIKEFEAIMDLNKELRL